MPIKKRSSATKKTKSTTKHSPQKRMKKSSSSTKVKSTATDKLASNALKLIDQAAELLRKGVTTSASQTAHMQTAARRRAQSLIAKAHDSLDEAFEAGTSALHKIVNKI